MKITSFVLTLREGIDPHEWAANYNAKDPSLRNYFVATVEVVNGVPTVVLDQERSKQLVPVGSDVGTREEGVNNNSGPSRP